LIRRKLVSARRLNHVNFDTKAAIETFPMEHC
jgi:hypothetical protein